MKQILIFTTINSELNLKNHFYIQRVLKVFSSANENNQVSSNLNEPKKYKEMTSKIKVKAVEKCFVSFSLSILAYNNYSLN